MTIPPAQIPSDVAIQCRCGRVRGVAEKISPSAGLRFICYCQDCQAFARFLKRPDVLNAAGGTDIFQMPVGRVKLTAGEDAIRCVRLAPTGVFRWYTDCCQTPIGNTVGPRFPMIGLIHSFMNHEADGRCRDEMLGPLLCRLFEGSVAGPLPPDAPPPSPWLFVTRISKLLSWWAHGLTRPNPFFDAVTAAPLFAPRVLTPGERVALSEKSRY